MKCVFLLFSLLILINFSVLAQEEERTIEKDPKHLISVSLGYTFVPKGAEEGATEAKGVFVPSVGLDYFYAFTPKWEAGLMMDLELSNYVIIEKDLNREKALVVAAVASYSLTNNVNIFAGGGIELEKNHNLGIVRFGTEYSFRLKNNWSISPGFFYDIKEGYDSWSLALAIGKRF